MAKHLICVAISLAYLAVIVSAVVDDSSPDLSRFKLRHVTPSKLIENYDASDYEKKNGEVDVIFPDEDTESPAIEITRELSTAIRIIKFNVQDSDGGLKAMPIKSFLEYMAIWNLIQKAKAHKPTTDAGKDALKFIESPYNQELTRRVEKIIADYTKVVKVFGGILDIQKNGPPQDLTIPFFTLENYLNDLDPICNVSEIRKAVKQFKASKEKKHRKFF